MTNKERFLAGELFRCGDDELSDYFKLVVMESSSAREHYFFRLSPQETWEFEHPFLPYDARYAFDFFSEITEIQELVCFLKLSVFKKPLKIYWYLMKCIFMMMNLTIWSSAHHQIGVVIYAE